MKHLLSLMLVATMTCEIIDTKGDFHWFNIYRCENDEVICYITSSGKKGGISCKFKEQEQ